MLSCRSGTRTPSSLWTCAVSCSASCRASRRNSLQAGGKNPDAAAARHRNDAHADISDLLVFGREMLRHFGVAGLRKIIEQMFLFKAEVAPDLVLEGYGKIDQQRPRTGIDRLRRLIIGNEALQFFQQRKRRHMLVMQPLADPIRIHHCAPRSTVSPRATCSSRNARTRWRRISLRIAATCSVMKRRINASAISSSGVRIDE